GARSRVFFDWICLTPPIGGAGFPGGVEPLGGATPARLAAAPACPNATTDRLMVGARFGLGAELRRYGCPRCVRRLRPSPRRSFERCWLCLCRRPCEGGAVRA